MVWKSRLSLSSESQSWGFIESRYLPFNIKEQNQLWVQNAPANTFLTKRITLTKKSLKAEPPDMIIGRKEKPIHAVRT